MEELEVKEEEEAGWTFWTLSYIYFLLLLASELFNIIYVLILMDAYIALHVTLCYKVYSIISNIEVVFP